MRPAVKLQIRYLDFLKQYGYLDLALAGRLPRAVEKTARQYIMREAGLEFDDPKKMKVHVTPEEHEEAEREIDAYLEHYRIHKAVEQMLLPRIVTPLEKGKKYLVRSGYFEGKVVVFKGTDEEVFGLPWLENFGHPACEKFLFRMQADRLLEPGQVYVVHLPDERRDVLLHEKELGARII